MAKPTKDKVLAQPIGPLADEAKLPVPRVRIASVAEMRELDRRTIEELGLPSPVLMERAALGAVDVLRRVHPEILSSRGRALILAGTGNNGGDGLAIARLLHGLGKAVDIVLFGADRSRTPDNQLQLKAAQFLGLPLARFDTDAVAERLEGCDLIVDALFGVGLKRPVDEALLGTFETLNERSGGLLLAVDVPSGLDADSGHTLGAALKADLTVTLACPKVGLLLDPAADLVGRLWLADIGIPPEFGRHLPGALLDRVTAAQLGPPPRRRQSHKGTYGTLLAVAGSRTMSGAARLLAGAALRTGVGLLYLAVPESVHGIVAASSPEVIAIPLPENNDGTVATEALEVLKPYFPRANALVVGPGMGRSAEGMELVTALLSGFTKPLVLDADGLNNLVDPVQTLSWRASETIITPHAGEMGRLLGTSAALVQQDRLGAALRMARETSTTVVLKGACTIIAAADGHYWINSSGNPRMAVGGSGDVLAGLIGGWLAQGLSVLPSALLGTFLHGLAADLAAESSPSWSVLPTDLIAGLPRAVEALMQPVSPPVHSPLQLV